MKEGKLSLLLLLCLTRLFCKKQGTDIKGAFMAVTAALGKLESAAESSKTVFLWHDDFGYIVTRAEAMGTGLQASVLLKIPFSMQPGTNFAKLVKANRLLMRQTPEQQRERTVEILNLDCLGITGVSAIHKK